MSTDSSELTFIRCNSCRSLVPALSTRCRMCGAALEQSADANTDSQDAQAKAETKNNGNGNGSGTNGDQAASADPLADFVASDVLSEFDDQEATKEESDADFDEEQAIKELDNLLEELNAEQQEDQSSEEDVSGDDADKESGDETAGSDLDAPEQKRADGDEAEPEQEASAASETDEPLDEEVDDELLAGEKNPEDAKANGAGDDIRKSSLNAELAARNQNESAASEEEESEQSESQTVEDRSAEQKVSEPDGIEAEQNSEKGQNNNDLKLDKKMKQPNNESEQVSKMAKASQVKSNNTLLGWLVSFDSPEGSSIEVRAGKFFVTANSLKKTDFIINDSSISTPHALVTVTKDSGLEVQDLLSEQGVFVKKSGESDYSLVEDLIKVDNGDWVKFGKVAYRFVGLPE